MKIVYSNSSGREQGSDGAFRARMQAQCKEIEAYRLAVERDEHRTLTPDQAAGEWIEKYAESFSARVIPQLHSTGS